MKNLIRWKLFLWVIIMCLLVVVSLLDVRSYMHVFVTHQDKLLHLLAFTFFMGATKYLIPNLGMGWVAALSFFIGLVIEVLQNYYTHGIRHFTLTDLFYNLMGIALGLILLILFRRFKAADTYHQPVTAVKYRNPKNGTRKTEPGITLRNSVKLCVPKSTEVR